MTKAANRELIAHPPERTVREAVSHRLCLRLQSVSQTLHIPSTIAQDAANRSAAEAAKATLKYLPEPWTHPGSHSRQPCFYQLAHGGRGAYPMINTPGIAGSAYRWTAFHDHRLAELQRGPME